MDRLAMLIAMLLVVAAFDVKADERTDCRDSYSKNHEFFIQCVSDGIYDPCDDAGGTWGKAQCAWVHNEIAERKLAKLEADIRKRIEGDSNNGKALAMFDQAREHWLNYRKSYCEFTNIAEGFSEFEKEVSSDWDVGFCMRRLAEARLHEFEFIMRFGKEE